MAFEIPSRVIVLSLVSAYLVFNEALILVLNVFLAMDKLLALFTNI